MGQYLDCSIRGGERQRPCLNLGANAATGRILTFCHSDTHLPPHWDTRNCRALDPTTTSSRSSGIGQELPVSSCAFSFGIGTTSITTTSPVRKVSGSKQRGRGDGGGRLPYQQLLSPEFVRVWKSQTTRRFGTRRINDMMDHNLLPYPLLAGSRHCHGREHDLLLRDVILHFWCH